MSLLLSALNSPITKLHGIKKICEYTERQTSESHCNGFLQYVRVTNHTESAS